MFRKYQLLLCFGILIVAGCSIKFFYNNPMVSNLQLQGDHNPVTLKIVDKREAGKKWLVMIGPLAAREIYWFNKETRTPVDEIKTLGMELGKEFKARNLLVTLVESGDADIVLEVTNYQVIGLRFTAFDPFIVHHCFFAYLKVNQDSFPIPFYFFNGKVPIWSFKGEIPNPCFNLPFSILVKEVASKINSYVFKTKATDEEVKRLADLVSKGVKDGNDDVFWNILALGATNNMAALPTVKQCVGNEDRFIRGIALSAIGTLGALDEFEFLKTSYEKLEEVDKYLAFKSLGDLAYLGSQQARDYIDKVKKMNRDANSLAVLNYLDNIYKL